jgi:ribonuclease HI
MTLEAYTDGASRGNPGESGIGIIVRDDTGATRLTGSGYIGITTNNVAEYTALLALLAHVKKTPCSRLVIHSDSELMVRQINGDYRVRDRNLKTFHGKVLRLLSSLPFAYEVKHIPRAMNRDADRLANEGIDGKKKFVIK